MPMERPTASALAQIAAAYGFDVSPDDLQHYRVAADESMAAWDLVELLYAEHVPAAPDRTWTHPSDDDNPLGAWYVQTEIQECNDGPLAGRRIVIKDNTSVAGVPMMNGSRMLEGFTPREDATVVSRLLRAGAVIVGKSVCEDLCMSAGSHTSKTGPVRNPWDPSRSTGGSSSGSGVLVATGEADMAVSGDQGGSIRIPAACLGVVGHKPTWGLVPYTGAVPVELTLDHLGPTARTVTDAAQMLTVIAGTDGLDPRQPSFLEPTDYAGRLDEGVAGLRVGVVTEGFGHANSEPEVDETVRAAVGFLRSAGTVAEEVSIPWHLHAAALFSVIAFEGALAQLVDGNTFGSGWKGRYDPELMSYYGSRRQRDPAAFSESLHLTMLAGRHARNTAHGRHYAMARNLEPTLSAAYDDALRHYDVLVMPTSPIRATPLPGPGAEIPEILARGTEMLANTAAFNVTGHPACSVPAGMAGGLPVGMMIIGRKFDDAAVLRVAHAFEAEVGGFQRWERTKDHA
ncbi:amidase [Nocardioides kongjuensis]|uniref:Amidase n=1 Tax=Nocardioides kongjuensis TaxID=349522 RepID=A0A852RN08_9ACTN|nr:amidase [Nocardioides kongjuensis]NYD31968.1 amidase [Nocardioides kongjuensis]